MEHLYLGFTADPQNSYINTENFSLIKLNLDQETKEQIHTEINKWEVQIYDQWYNEDLTRNDIREGETTKCIPAKDIVNMAGPVASNEIAGGFLVEDSKFAGIIIRFHTYYGFGMSEHHAKDYCIFKTNGEIIGKASFRSGHCSTEVDEWSFQSYSFQQKEE